MRQYVRLFVLVAGLSGMAQQSARGATADVVITSNDGKTGVIADEHGVLHVNASQNAVREFRSDGVVRYSDFGAVGDGQTDDMEAIVAAHAFANLHALPVKADSGATYYISGKDRTAIIKTDTDFGTASFIIDDTAVQNHKSPVFQVSSSQASFKLTGVSTLKRDQEKIDVSLPGPCLVTAYNSNVKRYIRYGSNQNDGASQTDIFIVDKNGNVDMDAPIIWDFDQITSISALPIDETTLTVTGGRFTTIAYSQVSSSYHNRGFAIKRSNVVVDGMVHLVTGEGADGPPYTGFINASDCSYVTVRNTVLTGHKTYYKIGSAGVKVSMGTYDISLTRALNVSFINCSQSNDIKNSTYWGIMGSNYCKNLVLDSCSFSRFDAHQGVANATIRNSTLGHMGINAIGRGVFTVENSTIHGKSLINLRSDYGSTWEGEFIIRNCVFAPPGGSSSSSANLIGGSNAGQHDFGYTCYMPERITIENLHIDDSKYPADYRGPVIFANFNSKMTDHTYVEQYPYVITKEVLLRNVTVASGKAIRVSDNLYMFRDVNVTAEQGTDYEDHRRPFVTGTAKMIDNITGFVEASSSSPGTIYFVEYGLKITSKAELDSLVVANRGRKVAVSEADVPVIILATGLPGGYYVFYAVDEDGRVSMPATGFSIVNQTGPVTGIETVELGTDLRVTRQNHQIRVDPGVDDQTYSLDVYSVTGQVLYRGKGLSGIQMIDLNGVRGVVVVRMIVGREVEVASLRYQ